MTDTPTVFIIHRCPCGKVVANKGDLCVAHGVEKAVRDAKVALLRELAAEFSVEAYKPEPECTDPQMQAAREGYREGLKWAGKKLGWQADALEKGTPP
jgi:hypothetical protein